MSLDVRVDAEKETVWLTQAEMAELFVVDRTRITRHVNSILQDEEVDSESNVRKTHFANADTVGLHLRSIYWKGELETSTYEESSVVRFEGPVVLY